MDPTSLNPDEVIVAECRVTNVKPEAFAIDIVSEGPNTYGAFDVPWCVPYRNPMGGGIDFMPEVGSTCWVMWHPWDNIPLVLGFSSQFNPNIVWHDGRHKLNPGDIILWTRDENRVVVRRGGNIEVISTKECKRYYVAARHAIEDFCRDWVMNARGGKLEWTTDSNALAAASNARSVFSLGANRYGQDGAPSVEIRMGGLKDRMRSNPLREALFWMEIPGKFRFAVSEDGAVEAGVLSNYNASVDGCLSLEVKLDASLKAGTGITLESTAGNLKLISRAGNHIMEAQSSTETLMKTKQISATSILLGKSAREPAVKGTQLATWLSSHVHPQIGSPPAQIPTLPTIFSSTVLVE